MGCCFSEESVRQSTDEHTDLEEATVSLTASMFKEAMCDPVWAYTLKSKSVAEDPCVADEVVDNLNTIGMSKDRIIVKSDQMSSNVELQSEIARRRSDYGTSLNKARSVMPTATGRWSAPSATLRTGCAR